MILPTPEGYTFISDDESKDTGGYPPDWLVFLMFGMFFAILAVIILSFIGVAR